MTKKVNRLVIRFNQNILPNNLINPVINDDAALVTLKKWETSLAFAVTIINLKYKNK